MNHLSLFTIIIPHFTKSNTLLLERAVNSIPDSESIQILVVDNSPISINKNLFEKRNNVEILYSDKRKGAGHARNIGLEHAKGKWLLFLDADDFFIDKEFKVMGNYTQSSYDIVFFKMNSCYSDTYEVANRHLSYSKIIDEYIIEKDEYNLRCSYPSPCGKMIRLDLVKDNNILFDEVPASNDVMFSLKTGLTAKTIFVDQSVVYCITVAKGSLTNTISLDNIESRFSVAIRKNEMLKVNGYKKNSSVMFFILSSMRFGVVPFFRLFWKALVSGNLFVGYNRWFNTLLSRDTSKIKAYKVKE